MKRWLAVLVVLLLGTQASMVGTVAGDLSLLTDGGQTDSLDRPLVLWTSLYDGRILTVDNEGNVSVNTFNNGVLSQRSGPFSLMSMPTTPVWTMLKNWSPSPTTMAPMWCR